jgi:perosamine synthetase
MATRIGRTLPPAAVPLRLTDLLSGVGGLLTGAKSVERFKEEIREFFGVRYCFTVSSGKAALVLILQALHELSPQRDEVLVPAYTCYSVPSAILRAGLKIRLCDVSPDTLDFDFDRLEEQLDNHRLLCVIPTHLFGLPADVERVKSLVDQKDMFVVEDAAQAMGGEWKGRKMGTLGDVGLFSMGRGKAFSTVEGGIILTDDESIGRAIGKRLGAIAGYGALDFLKLALYAAALWALIHPWIYWLPKSLPFLKLGETHFDPSFPVRRLSAFQAGLARGWKEKMIGLKKIRSENAKKIALRGIRALGGKRGVMPDLIRFPVLMADADAKRRLLAGSEKTGLGISNGYPDSIDGIWELRYPSNERRFPGAKDCAERVVSLPIHPYVSERDIRKIAQLVMSES